MFNAKETHKISKSFSVYIQATNSQIKTTS